LVARADRAGIVGVTHPEDTAMEIQIVDFMIHIDETLPPENLEKLESVVRRNESVISATIPRGKPHLMMVTYNPQRGSARDILSSVEREGCHAELVGM
jgi:hypothetical protein